MSIHFTVDEVTLLSTLFLALLILYTIELFIVNRKVDLAIKRYNALYNYLFPRKKRRRGK